MMGAVICNSLTLLGTLNPTNRGLSFWQVRRRARSFIECQTPKKDRPAPSGRCTVCTVFPPLHANRQSDSENTLKGCEVNGRGTEGVLCVFCQRQKRSLHHWPALTVTTKVRTQFLIYPFRLPIRWGTVPGGEADHDLQTREVN